MDSDQFGLQETTPLHTASVMKDEIGKQATGQGRIKQQRIKHSLLCIFLFGVLTSIGILDYQVFGLLFLLFKQGHDTTASGITWALYLLGSHPAIQERVREEVDTFFGEIRIHSSNVYSPSTI